MALSGQKKIDASVSEFNSQPIIPPENLGEVLGQIESALKQLKIDDKGVMASITTSDQKTWKIYVKSNRADKIGTKLDHLDIYVIDESKALGESQAAVVLGQNIITHQMIAVKVQKPSSPSFEEDLLRENESLAAANRFFGYCAWFDEAPEAQEKESKDAQTTKAEKSVTHYTFMRYFPGVNLLEHLYEIKKPDEKGKPKIYASKKKLDDITLARLAVKALQELILMYNDVKRMHRDIKTANFVISSNALKLIDLGTALPLGDASDMHPHSYGYLPPEHCPGEFRRPWNFASDLWQIGIVIAEIMTSENYQAQLQELDDHYVSMDKIRLMMSDVFSPDALVSVDEKQNPLRHALLQLIHKITVMSMLDRPLREEILSIIPNLTRLITTEQLKTTTATSRLKRGTTAKGSAPLPSDPEAVQPSPSSPILPLPSELTEAKKKTPLLRSKSSKKLTNFLDDIFGSRSRATSAASAKQKALSPREPLQKSEPLLPVDEQLAASIASLKLEVAQTSTASTLQAESPIVERKMSESEIMTKLQALKLSFEKMSQTPQSNSGGQLQCLMLSRKLAGLTQSNPGDPSASRLKEALERAAQTYRQSGQGTLMDKKMEKLSDLLQRLGSPKM